MHGQKAPPQPIAPAYHLRILADEQLADLRSLTLELVEADIHHPPAGPGLCQMNNGQSWPAS